MSDKVARLAGKTHAEMTSDVCQLLEHVKDELATGKKEHTCGLVILLDNRGDRFDVSFRAVGMRNSEGIAAMRVVETLMVREMGI